MAGPDLDYEAIIIGSGFGGSINFCRLAQKWGNKVLLLERGRRYPMASFARSPKQIADSFWSIDGNAVKRPKHIQDKKLRGLFDIRNYKKMDAVISAGLGGGSLIYANVFLEPPAHIFEQGWPAAINRDTLQPYYRVAKQVLGARPVPSWQTDPRRKIVRTELFQEFAAHDNRTSKLADICIFFGNDYSYNGREQPLAIGLQEKNRYGATQTSCTYCGECDIGCNTHSKNTLDLNYLYAGEHRHGGQIQTDRQAEKIVPLGADGNDDPQAGGEYGYRVEFRDLEADTVQTVTARRVVVSAGTFGTNELLLRCRDIHRTLPKLSAQLGRWFSGNGDFLSFAIEGKKEADPNYGPVITQYTDYHLFDRFQRDRAFILEDASYPATLAWYIEGAFPTSVLRKLVRAAKALIAWLKKYLVSGVWNGSLGFSLHEILKDDLSSKSGVLLCMGLDNGDGRLTLNQEGRIDLDWPQDSSMNLYQAILDAGKRFNTFIRGKLFLPLPTWELPVKHNVTVHPLGGCILADSAEKGVVSAESRSRGQAFGYQGLYIADGSILPSAVGANPIATISATAEWIAEGITGIAPDASLGV